MSLPSTMQVTFQGHRGYDLNQEVDITGFVGSLSFTHSVRAPWETIQIGLQLPAQLWQKVLAGVPREDGRIPKPGFWVVVWLYPANKKNFVSDTGQRTAIAWGYVHSVTTGFTHHDGGQQTTQMMHVNCISWLALIGKSSLSLAAPESTAGKEGFVYNLDKWDTALMEVLNTFEKKNPGLALQYIFNEVVRVYFPTTLTGSQTRDFGQDIPVVWDAAQAHLYAPSRAAATQAIEGQAIHSSSSAIPGKQSLLAWLMAIFVPDSNMIEMFSSLEYPRQGDAGGVQFTGTPAAKALGGAQPVLVYRYRPFNLSAINQESLRLADQKDGYGTDSSYTPTASQQAGLYQTPVKPMEHGFADPFYEIPAGEIMGVEGVEWNDDNRVNLTFVNSFLGNLGPIQGYDVITSPVVQDLSDFNRYGQRSFDIAWPFVPPVQGQEVPTNQSTNDLRTALDAIGELAWSLNGGAEQTCSGRIKTLFVPWRKAGHWFSAEIRLQQGNDKTRLAFLTGYIEQVTHSSRIVNPETGHTEMDTIVHFSRGLFSDRPGNFFWTAAGKETRLQRAPAPDSRPADTQTTGTNTPSISQAEAEKRIKQVATWVQNLPSIPLAIGQSFLLTPGVPASELLDTPEKKDNAIRQLLKATKAAQQTAGRSARGAPVPKFDKFPSSISHDDKQTTSRPENLRIFTLANAPFQADNYRARQANLIRFLVIHHTFTDGRDSAGTVSALKVRGTSTHFVVESDGTVFMLLNPDLWIAEHASGFNTNSIGIDFAGSLHINATPPAQAAAGQLLIDFLLRRYGLTPKIYSPSFRATNHQIEVTDPVTGVKTKVQVAGNNPRESVAQVMAQQYTVLRHYNVWSTACPGKAPVERMCVPVNWQYAVAFEPT